MLGAIYGDIVGSVYEFNNIRTKNFELFSEKSKFTDDTVMTLAVADALLHLDKARDIERFKNILIEKMHCYGDKYPHAGYGGHFRFWLSEKQTEPYGSYGNGLAMRVSPVAWYANSLEECLDFAKASAEVTHNHPEGIKGAVCTAGATYLARTGATIDEIKTFVAKYYEINFTLDEIRPTYEFNETCQDTVPQAMQAFFESTSFEDAIRNAISIGGDSDTLAAITGAVAEAYYGMTDMEVQEVTSRLDQTLLKILTDFRNKFIE
ncbi:MAG: ADP-ribosylglycohydrolase [Ruminococcaceae bacterium]|nr:ADP-ribosylglycohydrolase [Oscillospiraceae bacterium]